MEFGNDVQVENDFLNRLAWQFLRDRILLCDPQLPRLIALKCMGALGQWYREYAAAASKFCAEKCWNREESLAQLPAVKKWAPRKFPMRQWVPYYLGDHSLVLPAAKTSAQHKLISSFRALRKVVHETSGSHTRLTSALLSWTTGVGFIKSIL